MTKAKETAPAFMRQRRPGSGLYRRYRAFRLMRNVRAVVSAGLSGVMGKLGFQVFKSRQINREAYAQKLEAL